MMKGWGGTSERLCVSGVEIGKAGKSTGDKAEEGVISSSTVVDGRLIVADGEARARNACQYCSGLQPLSMNRSIKPRAPSVEARIQKNSSRIET